MRLGLTQLVELEFLAAYWTGLAPLQPFIDARQVKLMVAPRRDCRILCKTWPVVI